MPEMPGAKAASVDEYALSLPFEQVRCEEVSERLVFVSSSLHHDSLAAASRWRHQAGRAHRPSELREMLSLVLQGFLPAVWRGGNE